MYPAKGPFSISRKKDVLIERAVTKITRPRFRARVWSPTRALRHFMHVSLEEYLGFMPVTSKQ